MSFLHSLSLALLLSESCLFQEPMDKKELLKKLDTSWADYRERVDLHLAKGWNIRAERERELHDARCEQARYGGGTDHYLNNGDGFIMLNRYNGSKIQGANPRYSFEIWYDYSSGKFDDRRLSLKTAELVKNEQEYKSFEKPDQTWYELSKELTVYQPFFLDDKSWKFFIDQPYFRITKTTELSIGGERVTKVEFTSHHPPGDAPANDLQEGSLLFFSDRFWLPHSYRIINKRKGFVFAPGDVMPDWTYTESREFTYTSDRLPFLKNFVSEHKGEGRESHWHLRHDLEYLPGASDLPIRHFTVGHYGLKEPGGIVWVDPQRHYLWSVGGLVALGLFGAFFLVKRKTW